MKISTVGDELFHADGQTYRHNKLIVAFRNFANAPKTSLSSRNFVILRQ